jgi:hypothetical protein
MIGKIFITRQGYDPELGKHVKDPYLGELPSLGACRPDIRRQLKPGDEIYTISGKVKGARQFVMGGFEIASKMNVREAFDLFPEQRLSVREDGQIGGNIIIDGDGKQHPLDTHAKEAERFDRRVRHYVVGTNPISLIKPEEIKRGREQTLEALSEILGKTGSSPWEIVGRYGCTLKESQSRQIRDWLRSLKSAA